MVSESNGYAVEVTANAGNRHLLSHRDGNTFNLQL
jgi:hypothetical protein